MIQTRTRTGAHLAFCSAVLVGVVPAAPGSAGGAVEGGFAMPTDTIPGQASPLNAAAAAFARALAEGSGEALGGLLAAEGIRLQLDAGSHAGLSSRQAAASLREFLRGYEGGETVVIRAARVEDSPARGFAEIRWSARIAGTSQQVRRTLFLGFHREGRRWQVDEVRVVR